MACASDRLSHATCRLRIFRQLFASDPRPQTPHRTISTSRAQLSQAHDEAPSKTPRTPNSTEDYILPSQRLPQSPVITHPQSGIPKMRKRRAEPEDISELKKNPWAVALASPVRMCVVTGTRLPRRLMGIYGLVKRPDSEQSYLLPRDLLKDSIQKRWTEGESATPESVVDVDVDVDTDVDAGEVKSENVSPLIARDKKLAQRPALRIVTLGPLIKAATPYLATRKGRKPGVAKLIPYRWKHPLGPINAEELKNCIWRPDMPEYLLRHMRKDVGKRIMRVGEELETEPDLVWKALDMDEYSDIALQAALEGLDPLENEACGAVLLFGSEAEHATEQSPCVATVLHPRTQTRIPIFDLSTLLSESELEMLRGSPSSHLQSKALFFRPNGSRESMDLMLYLWKLQRFLAQDP